MKKWAAVLWAILLPWVYLGSQIPETRGHAFWYLVLPGLVYVAFLLALLDASLHRENEEILLRVFKSMNTKVQDLATEQFLRNRARVLHARYEENVELQSGRMKLDVAEDLLDEVQAARAYARERRKKGKSLRKYIVSAKRDYWDVCLALHRLGLLAVIPESYKDSLRKGSEGEA